MLASLGFVSAASANTVLFSSFESPIIGSGYQNFTLGQTFDGWTVSAGDVDIIRGAYSPLPFPDGDQAVDLNGFQPGAISQSINTVIGQAYSLNFWLSANTVVSAQANAGAGATTQIFSSGNTAWNQYFLPFTATGTSTLISFSSVNTPGTGGPTLDEVSVVAVPTPTSAMGGFVLLGLVFAGNKLRTRKA